ncbi:MAG: UDP-N-acetylmuramate dehydrogenase [Candidatus Omnitrophica bacterium]|nr:UDP-N-acetylmuramate dehydrogenase [Candidatus Omnitrophota bacterium]
MNWPKNLKVKAKEPLRNKTTFRIGGVAQYFSEPKNYSQLRGLVIASKTSRLPILILGGGSNLLIRDGLLRGLTIKLNSIPFKRISRKGNCITAGSQVMLGALIKFANQQSLSGLEFLSGIPGSFGGALAMNAGCWGTELGSLVKEVEIMDYNGKISILKSKDIRFSYRDSSIQKYIILSGTIRLKSRSKIKIRDKINNYLNLRRKSQDLTYPNAGSIFRNPDKESAGRLIDLCGLKGSHVGQAYVSSRHANFILNRGSARAVDVLKLMQLVENKVKSKYGIVLQPEIKIWR